MWKCTLRYRWQRGERVVTQHRWYCFRTFSVLSSSFSFRLGIRCVCGTARICKTKINISKHQFACRCICSYNHKANIFFLEALSKYERNKQMKGKSIIRLRAPTRNKSKAYSCFFANNSLQRLCQRFYGDTQWHPSSNQMLSFNPFFFWFVRFPTVLLCNSYHCPTFPTMTITEWM